MIGAVSVRLLYLIFRQVLGLVLLIGRRSATTVGKVLPHGNVRTPVAPPKPAPKPASKPAPKPAPADPPSAYYANCAAARAAGAAPLHRGEPGYRSALDRDGDGTACET